MKTPKATVLTQILFATLIPMLVVFVLVLLNMNQVLSNFGANAAREKSNHIADMVSRQMRTVFDTFSAQVDMLSRNVGVVCEDSEAARTMTKRFASILIEANSDISCVWFAFEPGSFFPGRRFKNSFVRRDGIIAEFLEDLADSDLDNPERSPWYSIPLASGTPYFEGVDYYNYGQGLEYSGTITYPVFAGGRTVGCVGLDVHYNQIFRFLRDPDHNYGGLIILIAEDGEVLFSNIPDTVSGNLLDRLSERRVVEQVRESLGSQKALRFTGLSPFSGEDVLVNLMPLELPHSSRRLSLLTEISSRKLVAEADRMKYGLLLTSLIGVGLLTAAVCLVTRNIVKPIRRIVGQAGEIAAGNHESYEPVFDHSKTSENEIYILEQSIHAILDQLKEKYQLELNAVQARAEREKMAASAEAKMQFFASMSHEIRTPMNAVLGLSQILMDQQLTEEQEKHVRDIKTSAESLLRVINDILDLSRMEIDGLELVRAGFDLHGMLDSMVSIFTMLTRQKGLVFTFSLAPDVPRYIVADQYRYRQILTNILGNAVKFTAKECVRLEAKADPECIVFDIVDSGPGIPEKDRECLFQPFRQVKQEHRTHGSGLGLSISLGLAKAMGGEYR